jgi:tetratricopeptide (TPR) repeat protein
MTFFVRPSEWTRHRKDEAAAAPLAVGPQHYFAFLSYSHRDEAMAQWLHDELEKFKVPHHLVGRVTEHGSVPRRLTPIFRDLKELPASDDLGGEIRGALAASRFLIVLCSPAAADSRWTNAEIAMFKRVHPDGHIFAAIVGGEPFASDIPGREQEESLPVTLRFKYDRRGHQTTKKAEPLAADLRGGAEERRVGFLKLVAGMLGVGLDELVRRDDVRRQRRLAILASASLAGMVVASGLAFAAIQARDAARDQRREAEGLVAFMLGDLKDKLEPIGKLEALDGVGARVLAYYEKQDASELPDSALLQRSRALSLTAQVAYLRGDANTAQQLYRNAMRGTAEAVRRSPDEPQRLFDHAQNVFWIGELARERSDIGQAEAAYREYKRLADRMVAIEPDNLRWRMEVFYANENLGIVLLNQRRFADAVGRFEGSLRPMESLASIDPANAEYQKELSNVLAWLADAERAQGRLKIATALRERQISFLNRLISNEKTNVEFRQQLIPAHQALGILLISTGEIERGIDQLRKGVAVADRLMPVEPDNVLWKGLAAQAKLELAGALLLLNRTEEAADQARSGCDLAGFVQGRDPAPTWRHLRTTCFTVRSRLALQVGTTNDALRFAEAALASARTERSEDSMKDRYSIAAAYRLVGDVRKRMGDAEAARKAWIAGLAQLPRNVAERSSELNGRIELLRRLNRTDETRPLAARLEAMGYRSTF